MTARAARFVHGFADSEPACTGMHTVQDRGIDERGLHTLPALGRVAWVAVAGGVAGLGLADEVVCGLPRSGIGGAGSRITAPRGRIAHPMRRAIAVGGVG
jgi:hypothetical protein